MRKRMLVCVASLVILCVSSTVLADDLGQSYHGKYRICVEKQNAGRELDYHGVCKFIDNQIDCDDAGCYWRASNEACMIDICLAETSGDGKVSAPDYSVLKKEFLRTGCPCNP